MVKNIIIAILLILSAYCLLFLGRRVDPESGNLQALNVICDDYLAIVGNDQSRFLNQGLSIVDSESYPKSAGELVGTGSRLVIRYSELNCQSCIDTILFYANDFASKCGKNKVAIWASYSYMRNYSIFLRMNKYDLDIYNVADTVLNIDSRNMPYAFVLNEDLTISHLFIPHKEFPKMTKWYFSEVEKYLNKQ